MVRVKPVPRLVQASVLISLAGLTDGNLGELGTPAFAFANPLLIDMNGDGRSVPGVANAICSEAT